MSNFGERLKKSRNIKGITQRQLSEKLGVAQSTIANYENNTRFPGNDILIEISQYLKISTDFLLGIDLNVSTNKTVDKKEFRNTTDEFINHLLKGNTNKAKSIIKQAHSSGIDILTIITSIFIPALNKTGDLWESNQISIAQEHYITGLIEKLLDYLSETEAVQEEKIYKAIFMVPSGEEHILSLKMAAEFFRRRGWSIIFIGRSIPLESLIGMIKDKKPDLLVLSVLTSNGSNSCNYLVQAVRMELNSKSPLILVGGKGIENENTAIKTIGADLYIQELEELDYRITEIENIL